MMKSTRPRSIISTTHPPTPAGVIARSTAFGTGTTYISSLTGDLGTSSAIGTVPGLSATTNAASRGTGVTLVLTPGP